MEPRIAIANTLLRANPARYGLGRGKVRVELLVDDVGAILDELDPSCKIQAEARHGDDLNAAQGDDDTVYEVEDSTSVQQWEISKLLFDHEEYDHGEVMDYLCQLEDWREEANKFRWDAAGILGLGRTPREPKTAPRSVYGFVLKALHDADEITTGAEELRDQLREALELNDTASFKDIIEFAAGDHEENLDLQAGITAAVSALRTGDPQKAFNLLYSAMGWGAAPTLSKGGTPSDDKVGMTLNLIRNALGLDIDSSMGSIVDDVRALVKSSKITHETSGSSRSAADVAEMQGRIADARAAQAENRN